MIYFVNQHSLTHKNISKNCAFYHINGNFFRQLFYFMGIQAYIENKKEDTFMSKFKRFIWNGLLITLVSLLIRTVSVSFNVYLSNRVGAVAMGLFTLISTVYGFAITVATSGIGLATTRLVAEAMGRSDPGECAPWVGRNPRVLCTVRKCTVYALCFSLGSGLVLFLFAPTIGVTLLHDGRTEIGRAHV